MNNIIDGKSSANSILQLLEQEILNKKLKPKLAIILVGNNPSSKLYVNNKIKAANKIAIHVELIKFNENIPQKDLIKKIQELNKDKEINGIIIQLPLPEHITSSDIIKYISIDKDVDGFTSNNMGNILLGQDSLAPCTALGCLYLLENYVGNLSGQNIVIIGRSSIVGKPLFSLLINKNATVTLCHSHTSNLKFHTRNADIVITAIGRPKFFTKDFFSENAIILDVGINKTSEGFVGDVDYVDVMPNVKMISPVPGGVGPMTVAFLLHNTVTAAKKKSST